MIERNRDRERKRRDTAVDLDKIRTKRQENIDIERDSQKGRVSERVRERVRERDRVEKIKKLKELDIEIWDIA